MSTFIALVRSNFLMLIRQRELIIASLGLSIISMLVFGYLFGSNAGARVVIGVADQDHSAVSAQIVSNMQKSASLKIYTGSNVVEQQALKDGNRDAVIVLSSGFAQQLAQGNAHIQVNYNQSDPVTAATTQLAVRAVVDGVNRAMTHQPGPVTLDSQGVSVRQFRTIDFITPGMLGMLLMWANLTVGIQLVFWRELGITRRLAATPLAPIGMIGTQVIARLVLSLLQGAIVLALAFWIFNVHIYGNIWLLAMLVTLGALTMLSIGFAIASFLKKSEAANALITLVSFPMMFLGGSYFNVNGAPSFIQPIIHAMPLYYLNETLRQVINNGAGWTAISTGVLVLCAWIVASLLVTWRVFRWL